MLWSVDDGVTVVRRTGVSILRRRLFIHLVEADYCGWCSGLGRGQRDNGRPMPTQLRRTPSILSNGHSMAVCDSGREDLGEWLVTLPFSQHG